MCTESRIGRRRGLKGKSYRIRNIRCMYHPNAIIQVPSGTAE